MSNKRVLSVGQCLADHGSISWMLRNTFGSEVVAASTGEQALQRLSRESFDLVLVNRVFDADGDSGIDWIRRVKSDEKFAAMPILLVSNYSDAQTQAVAAGARPGFGKAALNRPETAQLLRAYL
jgi:CheY-like chemotaxis protein